MFRTEMLRKFLITPNTVPCVLSIWNGIIKVFSKIFSNDPKTILQIVSRMRISKRKILRNKVDWTGTNMQRNLYWKSHLFDLKQVEFGFSIPFHVIQSRKMNSVFSPRLGLLNSPLCRVRAVETNSKCYQGWGWSTSPLRLYWLVHYTVHLT